MQVPMGRATVPSLELMGVHTYHVEHAEELAEVLEAGADLAFNGDQAVAVIISQRLIGRKKWNK